MAMHYLTALALSDALQAEGLVPPNCASVELVLPPDGVIALRYVRFLEPDDLLAFSRALAAFAAKKKTLED